MIFNKAKILSLLFLIFGLTVMAQDSCLNMGFELGNYDGWCRKSGLFDRYTEGNGYGITYDSELICDNREILDDFFEIITPEGDSLPRFEECKQPRFEIVPKETGLDAFIDLNGIKYGDYALKLGNTCVKAKVDRIQRTFVVNTSNNIFTYNYAVVLQETEGTCSHINFEGLSAAACELNTPNPEHLITSHTKPYFTVYLEQNGEKIECSDFLIFGDDRLFNFENTSGAFFKQWQENSFDLLNFVNIGEEVTVVVEVGDCGLQGHYGYAYFEAKCGDVIGNISTSASETNACVGDEITFTATTTEEDQGFGDYYWTLYDNNNGNVLATFYDEVATFMYDEPGHYRATYQLPNTGTTGNCFSNEFTHYVDVEACGNTAEACEACDSFKPIPGETYWLGAWVKEENDEQVITYTNSTINLVFSDANNQPIDDPFVLSTSGDIIDGWQRIIGEFTIPENTVYFNLNLVNNGEAPVYFDDVRVHAVSGNMKSFVYDPENYRLMAELDENNYATFYEYDSEGGLVRVKKETVEGVMTIQETRSSSTKN